MNGEEESMWTTIETDILVHVAYQGSDIIVVVVVHQGLFGKTQVD